MQKCVFLWLYAKDALPYTDCINEDYQYDKEHFIFLQMRWDNKFGTVGGKVDEGETIVQALKREVKEEINYDLTNEQFENKIKKLTMYETNENQIHSFIMELSPLELLELRNNANSAEHSIAECNGYNLFRINPSKILKAKEELSKLPFSGTANFEIFKLLEIIND